jgi:DNA-binding transcriptional regulator of glucitol operon
VKSKYFSRRAIVLHLALLLWVGMCASAAWWQVGRAIEGNSLSFLYSIEWPVFAVLGVLGWYAMLNMEKVTEHQEIARREYEENMRAQALAERQASADSEDPSLAAYNDHLANLSTAPKKKLWGH